MIRKIIIVMLALGVVGAGALEVLSYNTMRESCTHPMCDGILFSSPESGVFCFCSSGTLVLLYHYCPDCGWHNGHDPTCPHHDLEVYDAPYYPGRKMPLAPFYREVHAGLGARIYEYGLSIPLLGILLAAYPTIAFARGPFRRWCRRRRNACLGCEYDLTGNESGICPECGIELEKS